VVDVKIPERKNDTQKRVKKARILKGKKK